MLFSRWQWRGVRFQSPVFLSVRFLKLTYQSAKHMSNYFFFHLRNPCPKVIVSWNLQRIDSLIVQFDLIGSFNAHQQKWKYETTNENAKLKWKKKYIEKKKNLMHLYIGLNPVGKHVLIFLLMKFPRLVFFMDHPRRLLVTQLILYKNKSGGSHLTDALYRLNFRSVFPPSPAPLPWSHSGEKFESASSFCLKFNQTVILYQFGINWPS